MITGEDAHRQLVIDILSTSFDDNQSINSIVKQDAKRRQRIRCLMGYCFDVCLKSGDVYISDDEKACALVLLPELKKVSIWQNLSLILNCIGIRNILSVIEREKLLKSHHPVEQFYYLWFIGVFPEFQNTGIGSKFFEEVLDAYDKNKRPVYLETSVLRNISWYQKYGFKVYHEVKLGYTLYQMIRK